MEGAAEVDGGGIVGSFVLDVLSIHSVVVVAVYIVS